MIVLGLATAGWWWWRAPKITVVPVTRGAAAEIVFLLPEFSITENVALPMRALGGLPGHTATSRAEELLISFGLSDHLRKTPDQLSGGQRQRVAVARRGFRLISCHNAAAPPERSLRICHGCTLIRR